MSALAPSPVRPPRRARVRPAPGPPARLLRTAPRHRLARLWHSTVGRDRPVGWPLKYLLVGFPLWWVLGLNTLIFLLLAVPMALELARRPRVRVPPLFWMWGLFLAWQLIGLAMLDASPPTTHPGSVSGRLISTVFTLAEYGSVTVTLLYAGNLREDEVPRSVLARWMGWFFLTVCAGGFLGLVAPKLTFRSAIEYLLPRSITGNGFVHALVHPVAAQVQDVIGSGNGRPSAPFGYTNSWGNALSILVVWFVAAWVLPAAGRRRWVYAGIVAATVVPVVLSLNRGLWIGIAVTLVWLLARMLTQGHLGVVLGAVGATVAALVLVLVTPLNGVILARLDHGVSDNIRAFVAEKSIIAAKSAPIVGYGGNRHADGSASSITVGPSLDCPNCGDVATGSTGQLWFVMFNNGVVGTLLYFGFFLGCLWVYRRQRGPIAEAALVTIVLTFVYMFFYSALPVAPTLTMIAVAVLWREHDAARPVRTVRRLAVPRRELAGA